MMSPRLLLLDEPTASLSPKLSQELLAGHVRSLARAGAAVLLVEQKASAALKASDWAYLMVSGAIKVDGPAADLLERHDFGEVYLGSAAQGDSA
jgi:branched-chain amino acid transport system ATP-binding protein